MNPKNDSSVSGNSYSVSGQDICRLIDMRSKGPKTKSDPRKAEISPLVRDGDTLLFIVNYDEGWDIFTADKRMPHIIATSDKGSFDINDANPALLSWMEDYIQKTKDLKNGLIEVKDSANVEFWNMIYPKDIPAIATKGGGEEHEGEWLQLVYTYSYYETLESIPHLMWTRWGQESPFNKYCPWANSTQRCPVGCGSVAVAQIEHYWHLQHEIPSCTYSYGYNNSHYSTFASNDLHLFNYSNSNWTSMPVDKTCADTTKINHAASLMAHIGVKLNMIYSPTKSTCDLQDIENCLNADSVYCSGIVNYSNTTVLSKLRQGKPTIVRIAPDTNPDNGHFVVIDGFSSRRFKTQYFYKWMKFGTYPPAEQEEPDWDNLDEYVISEPMYGEVENTFKINWGWDGSYYYADFFIIDSNNQFWAASSNNYAPNKMITLN